MDFDRNATRFFDRLLSRDAFPTADGLVNSLRLSNPLRVIDFLSHFFPGGFADFTSSGLLFLSPAANVVSVLFIFFDPLANFSSSGLLYRLLNTDLNFASFFGLVTFVNSVFDVFFDNIRHPDLLRTNSWLDVAASVAAVAGATCRLARIAA